jgi:hypothetical protein
MFRRIFTKQVRFINTNSENTIKEFKKNNPNMNIIIKSKYTFSSGLGEAVSYIGFAFGLLIIFGKWNYPIILVGENDDKYIRPFIHINKSTK